MKTQPQKPAKPRYADGGWHCQTWNRKGELVWVFIPEKSDEE